MVEANEIKAESYENLAFQSAWRGRSRGMWGLSALGLIAGGAVGAIAPFFPAAVGAQDWGVAAATVPNSMAIFATVGLGFGFGAGVLNGTTSGAVAGVAREKERRELVREANLLKAVGMDPAVVNKPEEEIDTRTGIEKFADGWKTCVNFRVGAMFAVLGALGGALMAASYFALGGAANAALPGMGAILGEAATNPVAVTAYSVGLMGSFGALWSFNFPVIADKFQDVAGRFTSGRYLGTQWGPERDNEKENGRPLAHDRVHKRHQEQALQTQLDELDLPHMYGEDIAPARRANVVARLLSATKPDNYQEMVAKQSLEVGQQDITTNR